MSNNLKERLFSNAEGYDLFFSKYKGETFGVLNPSFLLRESLNFIEELETKLDKVSDKYLKEKNCGSH